MKDAKAHAVWSQAFTEAAPATAVLGILKLVRNVPSDATGAYWTILLVEPWTNVSETLRAAEKWKPFTSIAPPGATRPDEMVSERVDEFGDGVDVGVDSGEGDGSACGSSTWRVADAWHDDAQQMRIV